MDQKTEPSSHPYASDIAIIFQPAGHSEQCQFFSTEQVASLLDSKFGQTIERMDVYNAMTALNFEQIRAGEKMYWKVYPADASFAEM